MFLNNPLLESANIPELIRTWLGMIGHPFTALIRALQGSATVAMITAAGIVLPLLIGDISELYKVLITISFYFCLLLPLFLISDFLSLP